MSKKILLFSLFILIFLIPSKQDPNATTWERHNTTVHADSILAAIDRGEDIEIDSCKILGTLKKEGTPEKPDTVKSFIGIAHSTFSDLVSFKYCYFQEEVFFYNDTLSEEVDLSQTIFNKDVSLIGTIFKGCVFFTRSSFCGHADFSQSAFRVFTIFHRTTFHESVSFSFATFSNASLG